MSHTEKKRVNETFNSSYCLLLNFVLWLIGHFLFKKKPEKSVKASKLLREFRIYMSFSYSYTQYGMRAAGREGESAKQ